MIKSWQKVKHGLLHSGLRVIQPGVYVCMSASPCDPWPAVTLRPWWKDWVGRQEPSRPGMIRLVNSQLGWGHTVTMTHTVKRTGPARDSELPQCGGSLSSGVILGVATLIRPGSGRGRCWALVRFWRELPGWEAEQGFAEE